MTRNRVLLIIITLAAVIAGGGGHAQGAELTDSQSCAADPDYSQAYRTLRANWLAFGGVSTGSIASESIMRIIAADVLVRHAPALEAHAELKRSAVARLASWASTLDADSSLAFSTRQLIVQLGKQTDRVTVLAKATRNSHLPKLIDTGNRALGTLLHAHPALMPLTADSTAAWRWESIPWEELKPVIDAGEAITKQLKHTFDDLIFESASNERHASFLPHMTWFGAGLVVPVHAIKPSCPGPVDGLLTAAVGHGSYLVMLSGRTLDDVARFSRLVHGVRAQHREFSCLRRSLPQPTLHYDAATRQIEYDWLSKPTSCIGHLMRGFQRYGEATDSVQPTDEQFRAVADRLLAK